MELKVVAIFMAIIHHTDDDSHRTDEESVDVLTRRSAARCHRIGSHKHSTEGEAAHHEVVPPFHRRACALEEQCQCSTTHEHAQHGAPRGDARPQQDHSTDGNGDERGLTDRTRDKATDHIANRSIGIDALCHLSKRRGCGKAIRQVVIRLVSMPSEFP